MIHFKQSNKYYFFLVLILCLGIYKISCQTCTITHQSNFVNRLTNQLISFSSLPVAYPSGTIIQITYPPEFVITNSIPSNFMSIDVENYQILGNNVYQVQVKFNAKSSTLMMVNMTTPKFNQTSPILVSIRDSSLQVLHNFTVNLNLQPENILTFSLTSENQTTSAISNFIFTLRNTFLIPANSEIQIILPKWNSLAPLEQQQSLAGVDLTCQGIQNINQNLNCQFNNDNVVIKGGFTNSLATGNDISFQLNNLKNPYSVSALTGFKVFVKANSTNFLMAINTLSLTVNQPNTPLSVQLSTTVPYVNQLTDITFSIVPRSFVYNNSSIKVQFPENFDLSDSSSFSVEGITCVNSGSLNFTYSNYIFTLNNVVNTYVNSIAIVFKIKNILNYGSVQNSSSFKIDLLTPSGQLINTQQNNIFYATSPLPFNSISITPSNLTVGTQTVYEFDLNTTMDLNANHILWIEFPNQIQAISRASQNCFSILSGLGQTALCSVTNNILKIEQGFLNGLSKNSIISFQIDQILNSRNTQQSDIFTIYTNDQSGYILNQDKNKKVQFTSGLIDVTKIQFLNSTITGEFSDILLEFRVGNTIKYVDRLVLFLNEDFGTEEVIFSSQTCRFLQGFSQDSFCDFEPGKVKISQISSQFQDLVSDQSFILVLRDLKNSRVLKDYQSLLIELQDQSGFLIGSSQNDQNLPILKLTKENSLQSFSVLSSSNKVLENSEYTFDLLIKNKIKQGDKLEIQLPVVLNLIQGAICTNTRFLSDSLDCVLKQVENIIEITYNSNYPGLHQTKIKVNGIQNPEVEGIQASPFLYTLKDENGFLVEQSQDNAGINNFVAKTIPSLQIQLDSKMIFAQTSIKFILKSFSEIKPNFGLEFTFPQEISLISDSCKLNSFQADCLISGQGQIKLFLQSQQFLAADQFHEIVFEQVQNPAQKIFSLPSFFQIKIFEKSSNNIQQQTSIPNTFIFECDPNCLQCQGQPSFCTSCQFPLILVNSQCEQTCPSTYQNTNGSCFQCLTDQETCLFCSQSEVSQCVACKNGFYIKDGSCLEFDLNSETVLEIIKEYYPSISNSSSILLKPTSDSRSFLFLKLEDNIYVTVVALIVALNLAAKKFLYKEMNFSQTAFIKFGLLDQAAGLVACFYCYYLEFKITFFLCLATNLAFFLAQIFAGKNIFSNLEIDSNFQLVSDTMRIVKVYYAAARIINYKIIFVFSTKQSYSKDIYDLSFQSSYPLLETLRKSIKINLFIQIASLINLYSYWYLNQFQIKVQTFIFDFPIFQTVHFAQLLQQYYIINKKLSETSTHNVSDNENFPQKHPNTVLQDKPNNNYGTNSLNNSQCEFQLKSFNQNKKQTKQNELVINHHNPNYNQIQQSQQNEENESQRIYKSTQSNKELVSPINDNLNSNIINKKFKQILQRRK